MNILIVIGVLLMLAAVGVMYHLWSLESDINAALSAENSELRNQLHNALNVRKSKSRGITGKYRKAIEAHNA